MVLTKTTTLVAAAISTALIVGCAQQQQRRPMTEPPPPAPTKVQPAPTPAPAPAARTGCDAPTWGLIKLDKVMPAEAAMGAEIMAELRLTAQACAANVVVRDTVPANAAYVRSEPAAAVDGKQLSWAIGDLDAGDSRVLKVWFKPQAEGTIVNCASVSADPRTCASTKVVRPSIQLTKVAPAEVTTCDPIPMVLTVRNNGSSALTGVQVTDALPEGLVSEGKRNLSFDVGTLAPNQSRELKFSATAARPGKYVNQAKVTSTQGVSAEASATTVVREPVLAIACKAPEQVFMGRTFEVCFTVTSKGDTAAAGSVLQVTLPEGVTVKTAADGQASGNSITWNLGALAPNATREVCATLVAKSAGNLAFNGTVKGTCAKAVSTTCQTKVTGVSALLLETVDDPDPISVGENTTYTIRVTNQGTADDTNIRIVVEFPAEIGPVSASNGGTVSGRQVTFPVYPRLAPKQAFSYTVQAKGEKVGDARIKVIRTSTDIPNSTTEEESTRVY